MEKNFRMSKEDFMNLCDLLRPFISPNPRSPNYRAISVQKKVAICLYFLKDTGSASMTANSFGVHQSTVSKVVKEVCFAIKEHLRSQFIKMPTTEEEMRKKVVEFEVKFGMI